MAVKQKARKAQIIWIYGNKQKGVSVQLMRWARPLWRVSLWKGGRIFKTEEYEKRAEAIVEGKALARSVKKGHWDKVWS